MYCKSLGTASTAFTKREDAETSFSTGTLAVKQSINTHDDAWNPFAGQPAAQNSFCKTTGFVVKYALEGFQSELITTYKEALVEFEKKRTWHWFITVPVGSCDPDDIVLKRIRRIGNELCRKYLVSRYHKLPDEARFVFDVAFEGERRCGSRHAHILVYVPMPIKKRISREMLINQFPHEFRYWWARLRVSEGKRLSDEITPAQWYDEFTKLKFGRANVARSIYTVKGAREQEAPWSRVEFANTPKTKRFTNRNLSVIHNRNRQRRAHLKMMDAPRSTGYAV